MMRRRLSIVSFAVVGLLLALAGCATRPLVTDSAADSSSNIGLRLLPPESAGGPSGGVQPYELSGREVFRMPEPVQTPLPDLPAVQARQSLPPVTVCLNVVVDEQGQVQRSFPLLAHSQCGAGNDTGNGYLLRAADDAVRRWRFMPAAICRFAPGTGPAAPDDCAGAVQVEVVPVTLPYAFTFEIVRGQTKVQVAKTPH